MPKAWLCRSEGNHVTGNETTYQTYSEKIKQTIPASSSTVFSMLIGMSPISYGTTFEAKGQLNVAGAQVHEVWYYPAQNQVSSLPHIWPYQTTQSSNFDITERGCNFNNSGTGQAGGVGPTGIFTTDRTDIQYQASATEVTNSSSTFVDGQSKTFTPPLTQDYLIIASGRIRNTAISVGIPQVRLDIDGTVYGNADLRSLGTGVYVPFSFVKKISLSNASHTVKLQYADNSNTWGAGLSDQSIMCIPLGANTTAYNEGSNSTTTSFADIASLTINPAIPSTYMIIAYVELTGTSATQGVRLNIGGTIYSSQLVPLINASARLACALLTNVIVPAGSMSISLQGQNTTHTNPRIFAIDLTADAQQLQVCFGNSVAANTDNAEENVTDATISTGAARYNLGQNVSSKFYDNGWRVLNIDIKKAATVDNAWLNPVFFSAPTAFDLSPVLFNEDNTVTFSTSADFTGRSITSAVAWTPGTISQDHPLQSNDLASIVQTIINRSGWAQFNAIGGKLRGNNAASNTLYTMANFAQQPATPWVFIARWKEILPLPVNQSPLPINAFRPAIFTPG